MAVRKLRSMLVMAISHPGERRFKPLLADACFGRRVSSRDREAYCARANRQGRAPSLLAWSAAQGGQRRVMSGLVSNKGGREAGSWSAASAALLLYASFMRPVALRA